MIKVLEKCSLQQESGSCLLTGEGISGLLCFSLKLRLSNSARSHRGSTAFQSGASNSEKLILHRDTLHLPTEQFSSKVLPRLSLAAKLLGLGPAGGQLCPTSSSPQAQPSFQLHLPSRMFPPSLDFSFASYQPFKFHKRLLNACLLPCTVLGSRKGNGDSMSISSFHSLEQKKIHYRIPQGPWSNSHLLSAGPVYRSVDLY